VCGDSTAKLLIGRLLVSVNEWGASYGHRAIDALAGTAAPPLCVAP
jgi:hypothetical protein